MTASAPVVLPVVESGDPEGLPVVVLHGVGNSHRTFGFLAEAVDAAAPPSPLARVRLLRVDLRGHGGSPAPGRYAVDDYVGDVLAVLERTGPAVLVGHSLGGVVAWTLLQRRPGIVRAALLEDPPLAPGPRPATQLTYFRDLAELASRWQADGLDPRTVAAQLAELPAGPRRQTAGELFTPEGIAARAWALLAMDPDVLRWVADGSTLVDVPVDAAGPLPPVRILAADEACGSVLAAAGADALLDGRPTVSLRRLAGAGHGIHDEIAHRPTWLAELDALLDGVLATGRAG